MSEPYPFVVTRRRLFTSLSIKYDKMDEYFGIVSTKKHIRNISFHRDDENNRKFILKIESYKQELDPINTYIFGLPRDINNYIYSFLSTTRIMKHRIELPIDYPFVQPYWTLLEYTVDGQSKKEEENKKEKIYCRDWSPATILDKEILAYISTLTWLV
jgi:hypothetical protein